MVHPYAHKHTCTAAAEQHAKTFPVTTDLIMRVNVRTTTTTTRVRRDLFLRKKWLLRLFLTRSDCASRKQPFSTGLFCDWILLILLLIVSRIYFIVFVLFVDAVGVREYCSMAAEIGWQLCASRVIREQRVLRVRRTFVQAGSWRWA